jgi:small GTP-binding protein
MNKRKHCEINLSSLGESKKIVLLGDGCIGKSTLFDKLNKLNDAEYKFPKKYKATDNFDFNRININTSCGVATVDIWDTAGQENRGGKLRDAYLKGADGVLLLYDVTESKTKDNISKWLKQINEICPNIPVAVLGNKADKFSNLQQSELIKIRDCNLQRDYGCNNIKNFMISIKEDTHLEYSSSYWSSTQTVSEKEGCLIGLEYVLNNLFNTTLYINY